MAITDRDLAELRDAGIIDAGTADRIRAWSAGRAPRDADAADEPGWFDPARTAYYLGAVLILFALGWFALEAWKRYGGWTLAGVALAYGALFAWLGDRLWRGGERVAGGLLFTAAAGMTPLLVFSVQAGLGVWPDAAARAGPEHYRALAGHRVVMEAATILVLLLAVRLRPFAFHAAALAAAVVALAFDLGGLVPAAVTEEYARTAAMIVAGLGLAGAGYLLDHRTREDYSAWLYLGGLIAFWGYFSAHHVEDLRYLVVSLLFMVVAIVIRRRVFMVVGALGVFVYLMYLAGEVFRDSLLFPVALSAIGLAFVLGGVRYARSRDRVRAWLLRRLPEGVSRGLPQNR